MKRIWKPITFFGELGNYFISNDGQVKSYARGKPIIKKLRLNNSGYLQIQLWEHGRVLSITVHKLVAHHFIGPKPTGKEVNHKDGNRFNNWNWNLEYVSHKENMCHAIKLGLWNPIYKYGVKDGQTKLNLAKVKVIKMLLHKKEKKKLSQKQIGEIYGVSDQTIRSIKYNRHWTQK